MIITGGYQPTITYRDKNGVMVRQGSETLNIPIPVASGKNVADVLRDEEILEQLEDFANDQRAQLAAWSKSSQNENKVKTASEIMAELKNKGPQKISPMGWALIAGAALLGVVIIRKVV